MGGVAVGSEASCDVEGRREGCEGVTSHCYRQFLVIVGAGGRWERIFGARSSGCRCGWGVGGGGGTGVSGERFSSRVLTVSNDTCPRDTVPHPRSSSVDSQILGKWVGCVP